MLARRKARHLAHTSKRIDICAAQVAHVLHLAGGLRLEGKTCLELGAGWLLTHSLVFYLLGARRIISTDLVPSFCPSELSGAVRTAVGSLPQDILAAFAEHSAIRERFERLLSIETYDEAALRSIGIEYRSPVDLSRERINVPIDFAFSLSVFEHVPSERIRPLLENVSHDLAPGGCMIHCIHLEDHQDFSAPFNFYTEPGSRFDARTQAMRGNRVRRSEWITIFSELPSVSSRELYSYKRMDRKLPATIDASVHYLDESDLRTSHIGMFAAKACAPK